jgi:hypothetical protein
VRVSVESVRSSSVIRYVAPVHVHCIVERRIAEKSVIKPLIVDAYTPGVSDCETTATKAATARRNGVLRIIISIVPR